MSFSFTRSFAKAQKGVELAGLIIGTMRMFEELIPESGQGATKLRLVMDEVREHWDNFKEWFGEFEANATGIRERIKVLAEAFNASGIFKKKAA